MNPEQLDINQIAMNGGTQARFATDSQVAEDYAVAIDENGRAWPFPPVVVFHDGQTHWLADGFHRVTAARRMFLTAVSADIRQGTRRDAVLYAAGANADHGLRRTSRDKERAVLHLLQDEEWGRWSDREIARRCKVSPTFVGKVRADNGLTVHMDSERVYTNKHGQTAVMDTENIKKLGGGGEQRELDNDEADLRKRLRECLESDRLSQFREIGLTDEQLREYISRQWNTLTGSGGPNSTNVCCKGGADPAFYYNAYSPHGIKPTLRGAGLLRVAREVLEIPYPANERGIQSVPNRQVYAAVKQLRDRGYEIVHHGDINKWAVNGTRMDNDEVWAFLDNVLDEEAEDDTAVVLDSEQATTEEDPCRVAVRFWIIREALTLDDLLQMVDRPGTRPGWWASLIRLRPPGFSAEDIEDMVLQVLASDYGIQRTAIGEKSGQAAPSAYTAVPSEPDPTAPETAVPPTAAPTANSDSLLLAAVTPAYLALMKMDGGQRRKVAQYLKNMAEDEPQEIGDLFRSLALFVTTFER